jgi:Uma2 family endonuclease
MFVDVPNADETYVVFHDASWDFYEAVLREYNGNPSRVSYYHGTLEITENPLERGMYTCAIGEMISEVALEYQIPIARGGSTTLKLQSLECGVNPDRCFWIQNERVVRSLKELDLTVHPLPDLVMEIDVTPSSASHEAIYATLGVPEMWRFDAKTFLTGWQLVSGEWSRIEYSKALPMIRVADLNPFLQRLRQDGATQVSLDFRDWLKTLPR